LGGDVKLKELRYLLGWKPGVKTYGSKRTTFALSKDGEVEYARWMHPSEKEKRVTQEAVDALRKFLSPGDVAIDIGAHSGDTTLPMALAVGKEGCVLALEPNPYVFAVLKENAGLNREKTNIVPLMFAATPEDGEMEFQYSDSGFCNGGRFEGMSQWLHAHAFKLKVQGRNLSSLLKAEYPELVGKIRYIKTDTEGYDAVVLKLLSEVIAQNKPYLKVEVYAKLEDEERRALYRWIAGHGYTIHRFEDDENYFGEVLTENDLSKWKHFDIFCEPVEG